MTQKIASYEPTRNHPEWPRVAPGVRSTVAAAEPPTSHKVSALMTALTHLALFVETEKTRRAEQANEAQRSHAARQSLTRGHGTQIMARREKPDPTEWLSIETIERFLTFGLPGMTSATRDSYRRRLMRLRATQVSINPVTGKPIKLSESDTNRPYTKAEQKELWYWAHNQPTAHREVACKVLLCLGFGCGLDSAEICQVRAHDVRVAGNGAVVVHVRGPRQRIVQCRRAWESHLAERAGALSGEAAWLFLPTAGRRDTSLVSSLVSRARKSPEAPALRSRRMRTTWLVDLIESRVALTTIVAAAGIDSLDALSPVLPFIASAEAADAERQLRGLEA